MPGICLCFDNKSKLQINKIYSKINNKNKKKIIMIDNNLESHISLLRSKYNEDENKYIYKAIDLLTSKNKKYNTCLEGIGIFKKSDKKYVIYFSLAYDFKMQKIHKELWDKLDGVIPDYDRKNYHYKSFIPHITIPVINPNKTTVYKILDELLKIDIKKIKIKINNLSYLTGNLNSPQIYYKKNLK